MKIKQINIISSVWKLWPFINQDKRIKIYIYALLTVISGFADLLSIGAIIPFILVFVEPEQLQNIDLFVNLFSSFGLQSVSDIQLFLCLIFSFAVIFAGLIKISLSWYQSRLAYGVAADLGSMIFASSLNRSYEYHLSINSNEIVSTIANKANIVADNIIHPMLSFLLAFVTILAVGLFLFFINPLITAVIFLSIFSAYSLIAIATKKHIERASVAINSNFDLVMRTIREALEGIRYVILTSSQDVFIGAHKKSEKTLRTGQADISFASIFPRAAIESITLLVFAWAIYLFIDNSNGSAALISLMGAIVMSIQRLLPVMQQAYFGWTKLSGAQAVIMDTLQYLEEPNHKINLLPKNQTNILNFNRNIILEDVNFSYKGSKNIIVLDKINLEIPRYSKIGITGPSGSGKSTLIDLIMGFLEPSSGKISVDGTKLDYLTNQKSWQANISLVPQNIYLADTSIIHNIAFGLKESEIDIKKITEVIKITQLEDFINSLDGKYNYVVGEDGKNLSHGQKQRIAIARALYRNSDLLVIDEGTSALDKKTQADVISGLNQLANRPAIIMVAHRIETLENYDAIYELSEGVLKKLENI